MRPQPWRVVISGMAAIAVAAVWPAVSARQSQTFQASADLVALYVTVTDERGRPVRGLSKEDFTLFDQGRKQPIAVFSHEPQPLAILVLLDYSGSMRQHKRAIREGAEELVDHLLPVDRARVGAFNFDVPSRSLRMLLDPPAFTSDRAHLIAALRRQAETIGDGASPIWRAVDRGLDALADESVRRVFVLLSDGHDTDGHGYSLADSSGQVEVLTPGGPSAVGVGTDVRPTFDRVLQRVTQTGILMYGLGFSRPFVRVPPPPPAMRAENMPGITDTHGRIEPRTIQTTIDRRMDAAAPSTTRTVSGGSLSPRPDPRLQTLSEASGGRYLDVGESPNFRRMFRDVIDELHSQYLIGFVPAVLDGKTHPVEVAVRTPGAKVHTRPSYVAVRR
jgi:VWFA-related protein